MKSLGSNSKMEITVPEYCSRVIVALQFLGVLVMERRGFLVSNYLKQRMAISVFMM